MLPPPMVDRVPTSPPRREVTAHGLTFGVTTAATSGPGTPFVLLHGIGMSNRNLRRLGEALSAAAPVVLVEMPGHAGLPKPARRADVAATGRALGAVLEEIGLSRSVLVGHSMGSQWAVELAVARPDLVTGVVAVGPVADDERRSVPAHLAALTADTLREPPGVNAIVATDYVRCGMAWYATQLRHMLEHRLEHRVTELTVPLLVVRGRRDPIARLAWCRTLRDRAPWGVLVEVPGQAHGVPHTAPRAVAAAILAHARDW